VVGHTGRGAGWMAVSGPAWAAQPGVMVVSSSRLAAGSSPGQGTRSMGTGKYAGRGRPARDPDRCLAEAIEPKGSELTLDQKQFNKVIGAIRAMAEKANADLKTRFKAPAPRQPRPVAHRRHRLRRAGPVPLREGLHRMTPSPSGTDCYCQQLNEPFSATLRDSW
jgi:hypothetical protein